MTKEQFIEHVAQTQESLRRFLCVLCEGDSSRADDIAQEALLKAYMSFGKFEGKAKFSTWLFRIAYNCFYDCKQRACRETAWARADERQARICGSSGGPDGGTDPGGYAGAGGYAERGEYTGAGGYANAGGYDGAGGYADESERADKAFEHQQLYMALDSLSEHERTVTILFYMEDKSINDIVQITGMPSGTVRSHLSRARGHLREYLSSMR